jgi:LPXTG-motif cell wall-anchored protein
MNRRNIWTRRLLALTAGAGCLAFAMTGRAQVQTETNTTTAGPATREVKVDRATVVNVSGNDLVVKMEDGTIRHFANVPESTRVDVDGKELGIHDLKPGMKLQRTITTTTVPKIITTTQTVTGKVWHVQPPSMVILTLEDGTNQQFTIPKNQKFNINGQMVNAWGLKKGMTVSATKVVEEPITQVAVTREVTGQMPPPAPPPPDAVILVAVAAPVAPPAPAPTVAEAAPTALPKTGSELPLFGLLGALSLLSAFGLRVIRKTR